MATDTHDGVERTDGEMHVMLVADNEPVGVQNPLHTNGDSVYAKDLCIEQCSAVGFTFDVGSGTEEEVIKSLVSSVFVGKSNDSSDNPKTIYLQFNRPVLTSSFGINSAPGKFFSNTKIVLGQGDFEWTAFDGSADNTQRQIYLFPIEPLKFSSMKITFHTTNEIGLGLIGIFKNQEVAARIQAMKPGGEVTDVGATNNDNLKVSVQEYGDTPSIDAFDRLRVSNPFTLFDSKQLYDKQPLFWDEALGGSATSTHSTINAAARMTVTADEEDFVIRQTKQRFNYQPGKSQLVLATFYAPQTEGLTKRVGLFDGTGADNLTPNNGIFFECNGDKSWNIAKNGATPESVSQESWNVDKLDGTGKSGIELDMDATQILVIDYEWLGVGRVRVGFVIDGLIYYAHYFNHANDPAFDSVYMSTPNLPLRYSIETDGTSGGALDHICSSVMSEGGLEKTGVLRVADTGSTHIDASVANTTYAVVGIRLKTTHVGVTVIPESMSMINEANDDFRWALHLNPTIAGTFTYSDLLNSALQTAAGATANTISDEGIVIASGYASIDTLSANAQLNTALKIASKIDGTVDELVLSCTPLSTGADIQASLGFRELL